MLCSVCKGEYYCSFYEKRANICPYCNNKELLVGFNSVADVFPELIEEWSDKNEISPYDILCTDIDSYLIILKCKFCTYEYSAQLGYRTGTLNTRSYCDCCNGLRLVKGINSFSDVAPNLVKYWGKKNYRTPEETTLALDREGVERDYYFYFSCSNCGGEYLLNYLKKDTEDDICPYCSGKEVLAGFNSLDVVKPEWVDEWSDKNKRHISEFMASSIHLSIWNCKVCKGEYKAKIIDRYNGIVTCPYCNGKKVLSGYNSLADERPELAREWSVKNEKPATEHLAMSLNIGIWNCEVCKGEYKAKIIDRYNGVVTCPYCSGRRVLAGFNSFKVKHPDLMLLWDDINNYILCNPDEISDNYEEKVWWFCKNDDKHKFRCTPKKMLLYQKRGFEPCTYCKGLRRKKRHFV